MPIRIDVSFKSINAAFPGHFSGIASFVRNDGVSITESSVTSLNRTNEGWQLPRWEIEDDARRNWEPQDPPNHQIVSDDDTSTITLKFALVQFGSIQLAGRSQDPDKEYHKIATGSLVVYPQKNLFKVNHNIPIDKSMGVSLLRRINLFGEKADGDLHILKGTVLVQTHCTWEAEERQPEVLEEPSPVNERKPSTASVQISTQQFDRLGSISIPAPVVSSTTRVDEENEDKDSILLDQAMEMDRHSVVSDIPLNEYGNPFPLRTVSREGSRQSLKKRDPDVFVNRTPEPKMEFPAFDAVRKLLPKYHSLVQSPPRSAATVVAHVPITEPEFVAKMEERVSEQKTASVLPSGKMEPVMERPGTQHLETRPGTVAGTTNQDQNSAMTISEEMRNAVDAHVIAVLDYQTKELDKYRMGIRRLGEDVIHLRKEVSRLESSNSQLRAELYYADEDADRGGRIQTEAISRGESERNAELIRRLEEVQNNLIKANEREKDHLKIQQAHQSQQALLQQLQTKLTKYKLLEKTCQDQEKVIEQLEKRMGKAGGSLNGTVSKTGSKVRFKSLGSQVVEGTVAERKNGELNRSFMDRETKEKTITDNTYSNSPDLNERFLLLQKLERSNGRIMALEKQLYENTRQWSKEKTALQFTNMNRMMDPYQSPFRKISTPPLPAIEPSYNLVERQPRYYARYGRRAHSPYFYNQL